MKNSYVNNLTITNLYKKKSLKSKIDTQLLYGENFRVIKKVSNWKKIRIERDGYTGFIKGRKFSYAIKANFKVSVLKAKLFSKPNIKKSLNKFLTYDSRLKVNEKKGKFAKFENYWIKKSDIKKINFKNKDLFKDIKIFKNIKYLWGGKSYKGIDCSALVQVCLNQNNRYCPRDSKDQEKYFKKKIQLKNIKKNDIIFWKGHVAVALSQKKLIHAYGPMKKVVIMNIDKTIQKIYKTARLKVTSIRRV